jgi:ATP phosphoribosyltransferase
MEPLTVALPKGRLLEPAADLFRRLGWRCDLGNGSRQLQATEGDAGGVQGGAVRGPIRFLLAKPADVPVYVEYGAADLGIVGQDVLWESGRDVYEPLVLDFCQCRLVLAAVAKGPQLSPDHGAAGGHQVPTVGAGLLSATGAIGGDHPFDRFH